MLTTKSLPYCTENGINYYIDFLGKEAVVTANIEDENVFVLTKEDLRNMSLTARIKGIETVVLHTNYGLELHSKYENAKTVGFNLIYKGAVLSFPKTIE